MWQEFKDFMFKGDVVGLAVAVIIAGAFGLIVTSLVDDIIGPIIGAVIGGVDFTSLAITIGEAEITYGNFIQAIINFVIVAAVLFMIVRAKNRVDPPAPPAAAGPTQEELLIEIRDELRRSR